MMDYKKRIIIGLTDKVVIYGNNGHKKQLKAKIDTGAARSSMDFNLVAQLNLGPIIKSKLIKSAHGSKVRPVIETDIKFAGKKIRAEFTLADRSHMRYHVLIGRNILTNEYLIDPSKK